jgi:nucleoside-diphosphate-sugar epimerase
MAMPDAVKALLELENTPKESISQLVYNVTSFSPTAEEFANIVKQAFPEAQIDFVPHLSRQGIVDTWPGDIDDSAAQRDWGWKPDYDQARAFHEYLIPAIRSRYTGITER